MSGPVFWEDIQEGSEIPPLTKHPTTRQLVQYAGASGDFYEIHYDKDYALANELPGPVIHGALKCAFLAQLVTDWIGENGTLSKLSCQYRGLDVPGDTLVCSGTVSRKYVQDGRHMLDCEIWLENGNGGRTTHGYASVVFPSDRQSQ